MGRVVFKNKAAQGKWLSGFLTGRPQNSKAALVCDVSERTIRDWRRAKFNISHESLIKLCKEFNAPFPKEVNVVSDYWYAIKGARKGASRRMELYGPPGTLEGRKKGGRKSQQMRKLHPELYLNCIKRKLYKFPVKSEGLAELVGIILGDGGITDYQIKITLNKETEPEYIIFVAELINKLFGEAPRKYYYIAGKKQKVCNVTINSSEVIDFFGRMGLEKGNKVLRQADVPNWIKENLEYSKACVRGLMDTDGAIYYHKHKTGGFSCFNVGLTYCSYCDPLRDFFFKVLFGLKFTPKIKGHSVYLYRKDEIKRYFDIIGSHDKHHIVRFNNFLELKEKRRGTQVV